MKTSKKIIASALAAAMVMSTGIMTCAEEYTGQTQADAVVSSFEENADGTVAITINAKGNLEKFDFGVAYDSEAMEYVKTSFKVKNEDGDSLLDVSTANDQKDYGYVVLGGASIKIKDYDGVLAVVTFKVKEGATPKVAVVKDSIDIKNAIDAGETGDDKLFMDVVENKPELVPGGSVDVVEPGASVDPTETPATSETPAETETPAGTTTDAPAGTTTDAPAGTTTDAPAGTTTDAPAGTTTDAPAAPATKAPVADKTAAPKSDSNKAAKTGDAGVVLPVVAICGAAAAVAVASKKKVED